MKRKERARTWTINYGVGQTSTVSYGDQTVQFTNKGLNPSLSDDLFNPPEGANIQENVPMQ